MIKHKYKSKGLIFYELMTAMFIIAIMIGGMSVMFKGMGTLNSLSFAKRKCSNANIAQLDCVSTNGTLLTPLQIDALWEGVTIETLKTPGKDNWQGLTWVVVKSNVVTHGRTVTVSQGRYIDSAVFK